MRPNPKSCVFDDIGKRPTMEDFHVVIDNYDLPEGVLEGVSQISFYAVYDGHGGHEAAELLKQHLWDMIVSSLVLSVDAKDLGDVIRKAFHDCDKMILDKLGPEGLSTGSTAAVCVLIDKVLYIANIGDAEACVGRKDSGKTEFSSPTVVTKAHKASTPDEKKRIEGLGGKIFAGRIFGTLAIARLEKRGVALRRLLMFCLKGFWRRGNETTKS